MAFPYATLCVQGIKDSTKRSAIEAEFEVFGPINRVDITPGNMLRGVPDSRIAFVEFAKKDDARKAMQALNGRYVQGKCVMIKFARSAPGVKPMARPSRGGLLEQVPQTPNPVMLAAKFGLPKEELVRVRPGGDRKRSWRSRSRSQKPDSCDRCRSRRRSRNSGSKSSGRDRRNSGPRRSKDRRDRSAGRSRRSSSGGDRSRKPSESRSIRRRWSGDRGDGGRDRPRSRRKGGDTRSHSPGDASRAKSERHSPSVDQDVERSPSRWRPGSDDED